MGGGLELKRILILPLFTMESGHHRSSQALMESFKRLDPSIHCEKVDFLSYVNTTLEKLVSQLYLKWITKVPGFYSSFYKQFFYQQSRLLEFVYETLFLEIMQRLIEEKQPDVLICTHSFPSFLISKLKEYNRCHIPVVNIYTDFCLNHLWGKEQVDLHFVPSKSAKEHLMTSSVPEENIVITGIVTNDQFLKRKRKKAREEKIHVLVAGGSLGLGELSSLLDSRNNNAVEYRVLCGSNRSLYQKVTALNSDSIQPYSYISSPAQMNQLYDWADALITKPGGVTVSEALKKQLPVFIHSVLPGQEELNMSFLKSRGLVLKLNKNKQIEKQIVSVLNHPDALSNINEAMQLFLQEAELLSCSEAARLIVERMFNHAAYKRSVYLEQIVSRLQQSL
ncbi:MGDG synthase family glycosyltransferase [Neobacillus mesonae]|uniref:MGDG synthase family glycosyltransferase n=1 Tax=Neobacillus mesonae TaxID=1193713 RepID=UPI0025747F2F|nr:glycosyltransferase [Neobacillus mesonae]